MSGTQMRCEKNMRSQKREVMISAIKIMAVAAMRQYLSFFFMFGGCLEWCRTTFAEYTNLCGVIIR